MIALDKDGEFWTVTLRRPDKANSVTAEMLQELGDIVLAAQGQARVLVLTGEGRVFSAGADLDAAKAGLAKSPLWERLSAAIVGFDGLSIAALNGTAAGGSLGMVLACDLRISVPNAEIFYPVMKRGFLPQASDPARLAALAGNSRAKMIFMAGARISAEKAQNWGLIDAIVPAEELMQTARELAADCLAANPEVLRGIKELCR